MQIERRLEINESRHFRADDRYSDKLDAALDAIEQGGLIGELCREGKQILYVNVLGKDGGFTGRTKEGTRDELVSYLMRNHYV